MKVEYATKDELTTLQGQVTTLAGQIEGLQGMTKDILTGVKDKVAPRIDSLATRMETIEAVLQKLPEEITSSFTVQGKNLVAYVDKKTGGSQEGDSEGGSMIQQVLRFAEKQIDKSGGIDKLFSSLKGAPAGESSTVLMDLQQVERLAVARERWVITNYWRKVLGYPELPQPPLPALPSTLEGTTGPGMTAATGTPTLEHP